MCYKTNSGWLRFDILYAAIVPRRLGHHVVGVHTFSRYVYDVVPSTLTYALTVRHMMINAEARRKLFANVRQRIISSMHSSIDYFFI